MLRISERILDIDELDQSNADHRGNWYRQARKKIDEQTVHASEC